MFQSQRFPFQNVSSIQNLGQPYLANAGLNGILAASAPVGGVVANVERTILAIPQACRIKGFAFVTNTGNLGTLRGRLFNGIVPVYDFTIAAPGVVGYSSVVIGKWVQALVPFMILDDILFQDGFSAALTSTFSGGTYYTYFDYTTVGA